jgi:cysteine desulfurase
MVYLDWAATALPEPSIFSAVNEKEISCFGNPSSLHQAGKEARALLEESRSEIVSLFEIVPEELVFTSGGTESNNAILLSLLARTGLSPQIRMKEVVTTVIEHPSVYETAASLGRYGIKSIFVQPDASGLIDPLKLREKLSDSTALVSIVMVNNETGVIQPVKAISKVITEYASARKRKIIFHVDAVQALGKIRFVPAELGIDAASMSCHKLGGPKGVGALFVKKDIGFEPIYKGGNQEFSKRSGTENPAGIYGFALACQDRSNNLEKNFERAKELCERLSSGIAAIEGSVILPESRAAHPEYFSPFIFKAAFPPLPGEVLVRMLDERGFAVSTGAACSSRKQRERHRVLLGMHVPLELASSSIRISIGYSTTDKEIDAFLKALRDSLEFVKKSR